MAPSTKFPTPRGLFCNTKGGFRAGDLVGMGIATRDDAVANDTYGICNTRGERCRLLGNLGETITNPLWMMNELPGQANCEFCALTPQEFIEYVETNNVASYAATPDIDRQCPDRNHIIEFSHLLMGVVDNMQSGEDDKCDALRAFLTDNHLDVVIGTAITDIAFSAEMFVDYKQPGTGGNDAMNHLDATGQIRAPETLVLYSEEDKKTGEDVLRVCSARRIVFYEEDGIPMVTVYWEGQGDETAMHVTRDVYTGDLHLENGRSRPFP